MNKKKKTIKKIIPNHIHIETINGFCTARCPMCTWALWTRKPNIMNNSTYVKILEKFKPYCKHIHYLSLHSCGEPLLDKELVEKIKIAKKMGFKGIGFATNCTELNKHKAKEIILSGLDTIFLGIDGTTKAVHEAIRVGTDFDKVILNVKRFIELRNELGKTKIVIRFIRQESNKHQWSEFLNYWTNLLNSDLGDEIVKFDIHNWGGDLVNYESKDANKDITPENNICQDVFKRMVVFSDGEVSLCCADYNGFFHIGNVLEEDPIEIYNNEIFDHYRKTMLEGNILDLEHCKTCTIIRSRGLRNEESLSMDI